MFTDAGVSDYTVTFKLSNASNETAQRQWVVTKLESLYKQSNGMLPMLTATRFGNAFDEVLDRCVWAMPSVAAVASLGFLKHAQMTSPTAPMVLSGKGAKLLDRE